MADTINFDEMFSQDVEKKSHPFVLFGKEYVLPPSVPMGVVLRYHRLAQLGEDAEVPDTIAFDLLIDILGESTVTEIAKNNPQFDVEKAMVVLKWAMGKYNLVREEETPKEKTARGKLKVLRSETS